MQREDYIRKAWPHGPDSRERDQDINRACDHSVPVRVTAHSLAKLHPSGMVLLFRFVFASRRPEGNDGRRKREFTMSIIATFSVRNISLATIGICVLSISLWGIGAVPRGSEASATAYYQKIAAFLEFPNGKTILDSTLDDVLVYFGYAGLSARDLHQLPSSVLMDPPALGPP